MIQQRGSETMPHAELRAEGGAASLVATLSTRRLDRMERAGQQHSCEEAPEAHGGVADFLRLARRWVHDKTIRTDASKARCMANGLPSSWKGPQIGHSGPQSPDWPCNGLPRKYVAVATRAIQGVRATFPEGGLNDGASGGRLLRERVGEPAQTTQGD